MVITLFHSTVREHRKIKNEISNMGKKQRGQMSRKRRAVSPVISTLILSAAVLAVTVIASFLALNILELQSQQTEFSQATSNLQILAEIVENTGIKPGSGSFIRFNQRTGGIGYEENSQPLNLVVYNGTSSANNNWTLTNKPLNVTYRGGSLVSTFNQIIRPSNNNMNNLTYTQLNNNNTLIVSDQTNPFGLLTQRQLDGSWLNLDFNRVRIETGSTINVGRDQYQLVTVTFFNVTHGEFRGSGSLDVKVQNNGVDLKQFYYYHGGDPSKNVNISLFHGSIPASLPSICLRSQGCYSIPADSNTKGIIVMVTISNLKLETL